MLFERLDKRIGFDITQKSHRDMRVAKILRTNMMNAMITQSLQRDLL